MTYKMSPTCMDVLARAYYGLDLIGSAVYYTRAARKNSIRGCLRLQWVTPDHRITETGLWELRRAVNKQRARESKTRK